MNLTEITLPRDEDLAAEPLPDDVERLVREAETRMAAFAARTQDDPIFGFVPSDFRATYRALRWLRSKRLPAGPAFIEWGSGFGVVALCAATLGFHASGIEVRPSLVSEASALAEEFELPVEFVVGSFLPEDAEETPGDLAEFAWLEFGGEPGYDELGLDPEDFDVIFAYPWPGEEHVLLELFERHAAAGTLLLTWHGREGARAFRRERDDG